MFTQFDGLSQRIAVAAHNAVITFRNHDRYLFGIFLPLAVVIPFTADPEINIFRFPVQENLIAAVRFLIGIREIFS